MDPLRTAWSPSSGAEIGLGEVLSHRRLRPASAERDGRRPASSSRWSCRNEGGCPGALGDSDRRATSVYLLAWHDGVRRAIILLVRNLPTGTVTFLFTDIEGSTRLLHELGERYADVLAEHRRTLRNA